jgi:hypothetical protein
MHIRQRYTLMTHQALLPLLEHFVRKLRFLRDAILEVYYELSQDGGGLDFREPTRCA